MSNVLYWDCSDGQSCLTLCDPMDSSLLGSPVMGFPRQEHWSGLPFPSPGDLPIPGVEPTSLVSPALSSEFFTTTPPGEPMKGYAAAAKSLQF